MNDSSHLAESNRRLTERVPTHVSVMYSGMRRGRMLMGYGVVTNLSDRGVGIRGTQLVEKGMEVTMFIDVTDVEEPLCIAQCRVSWVSGRRFGVNMIVQNFETQQQLRVRMWNSHTRSIRTNHPHPRRVP